MEILAFIFHVAIQTRVVAESIAREVFLRVGGDPSSLEVGHEETMA